MKRMSQIIRLRPEKMAEYNELHASVWPEVLACIARCNIRNYSIFLREPENLLFAYYEYHGADYAADMAKMAADPKTQEWWYHQGDGRTHNNPRPADSRATASRREAKPLARRLAVGAAKSDRVGAGMVRPAGRGGLGWCHRHH